MSKIRNITLYKILRNQSVETPGAIALEAPRRKAVSYRRLTSYIDAIAGRLRSVGVDRDSRVAIILPMGMKSTIAVLGTASRFVAVPLNPEHSISELSYLFGKIGVSALLTDNRTWSTILTKAKKNKIKEFNIFNSEPADIGIPGVGIITRRDTRRDNKNPGSSVPRGRDTVFMLPTSGTTSKPKIVPLTHANVFYSAVNIRRALKLTSADRCLNVMPLFHVHGLMITVASLYAGGTVITTPKFNSRDFFHWLDEFKPTWYTASAGIQQNILLKAGSYMEIIKKQDLRFIRSSSAPLPADVTKKLEKIFNAPLAESYGMTEAALQITSQPLPPKKRKLESVGKPVGLKAGTINERGEFLPAGERGEIVIKGPGVVRGYEDSRQINTESFIDGWLRTGDLGFMDKDGFVFITGRIKEIINKGGEKISPREIDEVLLTHPSVKQAVAFSRPHPTLGEDVVVAIALKDGARATKGDLLTFMREKVSAHKIPGEFYFVDKVPVTAAGKPKRIGLHKLLCAQNRKIVSADTQIERIILRAWKDVLGTNVDVEDNFFEIGGDSIRAQELLSHLSKKGITASFGDIQNHPTVRSLSGHIEDKQMFPNGATNIVDK